MRVALSLAARHLGSTAPNPSVGCILVDERAEGGPRIIARGVTAIGGRPHAETEALTLAGPKARGLTAYVTLEPCAHHGQTGPCAEALVAAGIGRAVIACRDPFEKVDGRGRAILAAAGIPMTFGVARQEAEALNAGFIKRVTRALPLVTLKLATSLDGRIATKSGASRWITGEAARRRAHLLRANHDAVLVGSATALIDDPDLTCRLPGLEDRSPIRIVVDGRLRLPLTSKLARTAKDVPVWLLTLTEGDMRRKAAYAEIGIDVIEIAPAKDNIMDLMAVMKRLTDRGLTRVLAEGGAVLAAGLLKAGLVDRIVAMRAPSIIGGDGRPAIEGLGISETEDLIRFRRSSIETAGDDIIETYEWMP